MSFVSKRNGVRWDIWVMCTLSVGFALVGVIGAPQEDRFLRWSASAVMIGLGVAYAISPAFRVFWQKNTYQRMGNVESIDLLCSQYTEVVDSCCKKVCEASGREVVVVEMDHRKWDVVSDGVIEVGLLPLAVRERRGGESTEIPGWGVAQFSGGEWRATSAFLLGSYSDALRTLERLALSENSEPAGDSRGSCCVKQVEFRARG